MKMMTELQKSIIIDMSDRLGKTFSMGGVVKNSNYTYEEASKMIETNRIEYEKLQKIVWQVSSIELLLNKNISFVIKSLLRLRDLHVDGELDFMGFNKIDAPILCDIASFYDRNKKLSQKQFEIVQKKLLKYKKQLTKIANQNSIKRCKVVEY